MYCCPRDPIHLLDNGNGNLKYLTEEVIIQPQSSSDKVIGSPGLLIRLGETSRGWLKWRFATEIEIITPSQSSKDDGKNPITPRKTNIAMENLPF